MAGPAKTITPIPLRLGRTQAKSYAELLSRREDGEESRLRGLIAKAFEGKLNNTGTVTLATGGATTTDIDDPRISPTTVALLAPLDQNAAASMTTVSQSVVQPGKIRLSHAASGLTRAFGFVLFGIVWLLAGTASSQSPTVVGIPQSTDPTCNAGEYYLSVLTTGSKWRKCENGVWSDIGATGGAGEANTASNLGGGLANFDSKSGVDLRFNTFNAAHFSLSTNVLSANESGLEALLELSDLNGLLPLSKLTDDATSGKCLLSGGGGGDPAYGTCPGGGGGTTLSIDGVSVGSAINFDDGGDINFTNDGDGTASTTVKDNVSVTGWLLGVLGGDVDFGAHDILNFFGFGVRRYYADTEAEIEDALDDSDGDGCGDGFGGATNTGCEIMVGGGDINVCNIVVSGTTTATGRAGVVIRGAGGTADTSGSAGTAPTDGGTVLISTCADDVLEIGAGNSITIRDLSIVGTATTTAGIKISDTLTAPNVGLVVENVGIYNITTGYGIDGNSTGQWDTATFRNVSIKNTAYPYRQRNTQNVGIVFDTVEVGWPVGTGPMFDIVSGEFVFHDGFISAKRSDNVVIFNLGVETSLFEIRANQIEFPDPSAPFTTPTGVVLIDDDQGGAQTNEVGLRVFDGNHVVYNTDGNTLFDVWRRGRWVVTNNVFDNIDGSADHTIASAFDRDTTTSGSRLTVTYANNLMRNGDSGQSTRPEIWVPTTGSDVLVETNVQYGATPPAVCKDGEIFIENDLATLAMLKVCTAANTWTGYDTLAQAYDADLDAIAALVTTTGGRSILASTPADDQVYVGSSASAGAWKAIPNCGEAGTLNYDAASNTFSCLTDGGGGASLPVVDTTSIAEGSGDATKEVRIEVDGLTPGAVRVITMANADVDLSNTDADFVSGDTTDDDDLDVAAGGTGASTFTTNALLLGAGAGDLVASVITAVSGALDGITTLDADGDVTATAFVADDRTTEPGNSIQLNDNDTAFTNDPTCANSGAAGTLTIIDKDETAADDWVVCDGTSQLLDIGASGGGNSVEVSVALSGGSGFFSQTVTGQTWVASGSEIVCAPLGTTADGLTPEAIAIGGLDISVSDRVVGTGFTVNIYSPNGLEGTVRAHCLGV